MIWLRLLALLATGGCIGAGFGYTLQYWKTHHRLPPGGGELINWMLGL